MLYDPKWKKPTDIFSLESLIAWLEQQPSNTSYNWYEPRSCLVCMYLQDATGESEPWYLPNHESKKYSDVFPTHDLYLKVGGTLPWTFGAALNRARAANSAEK